MAFKEIEVPESPRLYTKRYEGLGGVDFSCDSSEVDANRTPTGTNMISDEGSYPVKRKGWRAIASLPSGAGKVLKMITKEVTDEDRENGNYPSDAEYHVFVMAEHGLYRITHCIQNDDVVAYQTHNDNYSAQIADVVSGDFFYFGGVLYFIGSVKFSNSVTWNYPMIAEMQGHGYVANEVQGYIPEVSISVMPDGSGAYSLEPINALQRKRIYTFLGDATSTDYYFYPEGVRYDPRYAKVYRSDLKVEILTSTGWETLSTGWSTVNSVVAHGYNRYGGIDDYTVVDPMIRFSSPHPTSVAGQDNIRITFTPFSMEEVEEGTKKGMLNETLLDLCGTQCTAIYGHTTTDRIFAVGGTNKNKVYYTESNAPTYFPDTYYVNVGYDTNEITGMVRVSDSLAVIKTDSIYDNTLYMIRGSFLTDDIGYGFTVLPTSAKLGALCRNSIRTLIDEPLFLTRNGVYGIANTYATTEKTIRGRSRYVDKRLLNEPHLENACAIAWNRYYVLCVNDHCYILDGRHKEYDKTGNTDYQYECYYWENFPAICFTNYKDEMLFATSDGRICKYNNDVENRSAYCDNGTAIVAYDDETGEYETTINMTSEGYLGDPIVCEWATPLDSDKMPQYLKTLNKKGNVVSVMPAERCSVDIELYKDGRLYRTLLDIANVGIFSWVNLSFVDFPFGSTTTVRDKYPRKKVKKYKRLQIVLRNSNLFEPLGIIGITKTYTVGNFAKK